MLKAIAVILLISCMGPTEMPAEENEQPACICTMQYDPVCSQDGKQFGNACEADCAGVKDYSLGECN